ncbi:MAG: DUF533 domain-containing protein [Verrucomicrobiae bacterium]|nr:DUF533 domain-containing protein [Verrucomicrobiae bacterium]
MDAVKLLKNLLNNNSTGGNILGSLLGAASGGAGSRGGSGLDVGGLLGSVMGGGRFGGSGMGSNIAGAVLGSLLGGRSGSQSAGGGGAMMDILGGLMGGGGAASSASGLHSSVAPQAAKAPQHAAPTGDLHTEAELLIRAMCNAAKSDGKFDEAEQKAILGRLGDDVDQAEIDFINSELSKPLDVNGFAKSVPAGLGQQVYAFSVMAIKLDEQSEARYLGDLAQGLGIDPASCNQIHEQLGAPKIFS